MANPKDFIRNVARAVEAGLDRDTAVRALTLSAAEIFGVSDRVGSIEVGKIADLVVTDGDLLELRTQVNQPGDKAHAALREIPPPAVALLP
jgi:imidazolonepropionase-like amidohydrolase